LKGEIAWKKSQIKEVDLLIKKKDSPKTISKTRSYKKQLSKKV
jgi:hypothetical protein